MNYYICNDYYIKYNEKNTANHFFYYIYTHYEEL